MTFSVYIEHPLWSTLVELLVLGCLFYNFKSSKPNGSASPFRRRVLVTLRALIRASYLTQLLDLLFVTLLLKIFLLAAKMNSLELPLPRAITPPPCHVPALPLLLCQLFLLHLLRSDTQKMTSSSSLEQFWILDLLLCLWFLYLNSTKAFVRGL